MRSRLVWVLGVAAGLTVANLYYIQPLLEWIARELMVDVAVAGLLVTLTQLGYVMGVLILVPLGDMLDRGSLATGLLLVAAVALAAAAAAPTFAVLAAAVALLGVTSVVAQVLVPFAAALAHKAERGRVVGSIMTGVMLGTLVSRTLSGAVASLAGWRAMFALSSILMLALAGLLRTQLPADAPGVCVPYRRLLGSVVEQMLRESVLRRRAAYAALSFGAFSAFWTAIPFLLARPPYGFSAAGIGAVALIGIPSAILAPHAGALADRGHGMVLTGAAFALMLAGVGLALVGTNQLGALLAGGMLITVGSGCLHVINQSLIYELDPAARSRLATAYMSSLFAGGMAGSALATPAFAADGWPAVSMFVAILVVVGLLGWLREVLWSLVGVRATVG